MPRNHQTTVRQRQNNANNKPSISKSKEINKDKLKIESKGFSIRHKLAVVAIFFLVSYFHFNYIYRLFENDKHFSHLSTLERELSFRTEMGLYYSYFKQLAIESPSFTEGFISILFDNRTEAPTTINVLERFNLYPEVLLSFIYRLMRSSNLLSEVCYQVNRGPSMSPVLSCEGLKEPTYFYVTGVFLLNGSLLGILFLFGTYLSKSILGGIITTLAFLFNHSEATRVMWTPPLRESFSFPFHILQLLVMTYILQQRGTLINTETLKALTGWHKKSDLIESSELPQNFVSRIQKIRFILLLSGSTVLYMLPWQFAQFALATQLLSLGLLYILHLLPLEQFFFIVCTQLLSLIITAVLMFGNRMLLTSLFSASLFSFYLTCLLDNLFPSLLLKSFYTLRLIIIIRRLLLFLLSFALVKFVVINLLFSSPDDDAHIWDILKSKILPSFRTFDTQLYTCAKEFDFIDMETIVKLCQTGLLPLASIIILRFAYDFILDIFRQENDQMKRISHHYHLIQTGVFVLMGILIMRLKLFPVPQMCLLLSLFMNEQLWPKKMSNVKKWKWMAFVVLVVGMGIQGRMNIKQQLNIKGEYQNIPMEKMIEWINNNTRKDAIFTGTMPTMANLKLSTGRSIVVHPHYEHGKIRRRVKLMYTMYSRKPLRYVHSILKQYDVDYFVYESHWCTIVNRPRGCSFPEMYDLDEEDPRILQRTTLACNTLESNPQPYFRKVFSSDYLHVYAVL